MRMHQCFAALHMLQSLQPAADHAQQSVTMCTRTCCYKNNSVEAAEQSLGPGQCQSKRTEGLVTASKATFRKPSVSVSGDTAVDCAASARL